ncbi:MAG: tetratricopeptide repeat protein [Muribaculaceae bacterium]|nr:tetratricopeptide repeat protein [Muribaculaceae bacterium]
MKQKLILSLFAAAALAATAQSQGYKDGIEYYKAGQYDNAKTILNNTLNNAETNKSLALYYLGQVALSQDDKQAAKDYFEKGVAADPNCGYNYVGLGAIDLLNGQTSQANDNFKKAQGLAKKDNELTVAIARAYYNADPVKYTKELNNYLDKARKASKYQEPAIYILEGDMLADNQEWGNAASKYEMAITYEQDNPEGYVKFANTYFNVNKDFAIGKLEELYNRAPNSALATRELAEKYYQGNHWRKAADLYGKYIQNPNHFPEDKARYSVLLYWGNNYDDSKRVAKEILAKDPSNFLMQRMVFLNEAALENNEAAVAAAEAFINNNPNGRFSSNDFVTYSDVLAKLGNDVESVAQYEKAVSIDPDNTELLSGLSAIYTKAGAKEPKFYGKAADTYALYLSKLDDHKSSDLYDASRRYLNAAATCAPEDSVLRQEYAQKGLEYIDKTIASAQPNPTLYQFKARLYIAGNNNHVNQEAVDTYYQMIDLLDQDPANKDPKNPQNKLKLYKEAAQFIYAYYGTVLKDKEKTAEAGKVFKEYEDLLNEAAAQ